MNHPKLPSTDALELLKKDHREVAALFKSYEGLEEEEEKREIALHICKLLTIHTTCEEELLYPAAHLVIDESLVYEAEIEHGSAKELIARIEKGTPADEEYDSLLKVLSEYIHHHVKEEENKMFPRLKESQLDLDKIGVAILRRKQQLTQQLMPADDETEIAEITTPHLN